MCLSLRNAGCNLGLEYRISNKEVRNRFHLLKVIPMGRQPPEYSVNIHGEGGMLSRRQAGEHVERSFPPRMLTRHDVT